VEVDKGESDNNSEYVLALGEESLVLVSGNDGTVVATHAIRKTSSNNYVIITGPPVIGDFNNDGLNDIIVFGNDGLYGYSLQKGASSVIFPVLVLILIGVMGYIFVQSDGNGDKNVRKRATD